MTVLLRHFRLSIALGCVLALSAVAPAVGSAQAPPPSVSGSAGPFDVVIEGGSIVDGSGEPSYPGDLAIRNTRIARITPPGGLAAEPALERIDASGLVVAPGFIDVQSQSRYALLYGDSRVISKVTQGVTTEIMGEGTTDAPVDPRRINLEAVEDPVERERLRAFSGRSGFGAWLRAIEARGSSVNFGSFLGGGTVRYYAMGYRGGAPSAAELDTMRAVTRRAMEDGAFGVATALIYPPGNFSTTDELVEVSRAMAPYGGIYATHLRSEADRFLEALDEAIEIGARGGVPVEVYHLKAAGARNWSKAADAVARIDSARAAGVDVEGTLYPYAAASTGLTSCLPPWASEDGRLYQNLSDRDTRRRIAEEMLSETADWENMCQLATPEGVMLLGLQSPENIAWTGSRLSEVARARAQRWVDTVIDLILAERQRISTIYFLMSEDDVRLFLRQPWIKFGSDAGGLNPGAGLGPIHPRAYGTFPRVLGRYVREEGQISLEEAVRKATSSAATRLSIEDRGLLKDGYFADVVVFDPEAIGDLATYQDPHQNSVGVRHVLVNGAIVVADGRHTGARPGRALRGPGYPRFTPPDPIVPGTVEPPPPEPVSPWPVP